LNSISLKSFSSTPPEGAIDTPLNKRSFIVEAIFSRALLKTDGRVSDFWRRLAVSSVHRRIHLSHQATVLQTFDVSCQVTRSLLYLEWSRVSGLQNAAIKQILSQKFSQILGLTRMAQTFMMEIFSGIFKHYLTTGRARNKKTTRQTEDSQYRKRGDSEEKR
jgi:hypothetical protein